MRAPAAVAVLPLLTGAIAGLLVPDGLTSTLALASAAGAILALLAAAGSLTTGSAIDGTCGIVAGCALAGLSLGGHASHAAYHPPLLYWFESRSVAQQADPVVIEGVLREDASLFSSGPSLTIDVVSIRPPRAPGSPRLTDPDVPAPGGVRLSVAGSMSAARMGEWRGGRRVRLAALLRLPSVYLDPGVRDERRALARRGVVLVGTVKSAALVDVIGHGSGVAEAAAAVRAWTRLRLAEAVGRWSPRSAAIATAVLIGDRTGLSTTDTRRLQDAGTYHVIAISGGNIAVLTLILVGLLRVVRASSRVAAWTALVILIAYSEVVVQSASVQRAITVAVVYLAARGLGHQGSALNVLGVAAALGIAMAPVVLFDAGFLLSFGATLGILAAVSGARASGDRADAARGSGPAGHGGRPAAAVSGRLASVSLAPRSVLGASHRALRQTVAGVAAGVRSIAHRLSGPAWALLWTTLAAEAALLPLAALLFGRVTFAGVLLNFAAIPLMSVLQALSMLALAASLLSAQAAAVCGYGAHLAAAGIVDSARVTEYVPWLARDVVSPAWWVVALYYLAVVAGVLVGPGRARRGAVCVTAGAASLIVLGPSWAGAGLRAPPSGIRIAFLDVGQGDATAVLLPGGRAVLVDAGGVAIAQTAEPAEDGSGGFDVGARVVAPALRALGARRLDAFTITHGDPDHIGGAPAILRAFRPPSVWEGVPVPPHPWLRGVSESADALGLHWRTVQAGDVERIGPVVIRVLHPPLPDWERQKVRNEDSVVLDIRIGEVSVILPGDIGEEGEKAILPHLRPAGIVILKAPHHGSATSSTPPFLAALRPDAVIFSAGRNNRFGHPAARVVKRYRDKGVTMFSTAEDGAVLLDTDGREVVIRGWTGRTRTIRAAGP